MTCRLTILFSIALVFFSLFPGCTKSPPEGLPQLHPCMVRVLNDSKPMPGIHVGLIRSNGQGPWSMGGTTDSTGTAVASTIFGSFEGKGVPEGGYAVLLDERIDFPPELNLSVDDMLGLPSREQDEYREKRDRYIKENRKIPSILADSEKIRLELTVTEKGGSLEIDISKYQ